MNQKECIMESNFEDWLTDRYQMADKASNVQEGNFAKKLIELMGIVYTNLACFYSPEQNYRALTEVNSRICLLQNEACGWKLNKTSRRITDMARFISGRRQNYILQLPTELSAKIVAFFATLVRESPSYNDFDKLKCIWGSSQKLFCQTVLPTWINIADLSIFDLFIDKHIRRPSDPQEHVKPEDVEYFSQQDFLCLLPYVNLKLEYSQNDFMAKISARRSLYGLNDLFWPLPRQLMAPSARKLLHAHNSEDKRPYPFSPEENNKEVKAKKRRL
jgi:hypothetical protein